MTESSKAISATERASGPFTDRLPNGIGAGAIGTSPIEGRKPTTPAEEKATTYIVERFKADGEGWQTRMNDALRKAVGLS